MSQVNHSGRNRRGSRVGWLTAAVIVSGGDSLLPVGRQDAPGMTGTDTHQGGSLVQRHVLCQQGVSPADGPA